MGWNSQVIVANQVIIEGPNDHLFVYNGQPGAGNLAYSLSPVQNLPAVGLDDYGNEYILGLTCYWNSGAGWVAINIAFGNVTFYTAASEAGPWTGIADMQLASGNIVLASTNSLQIGPSGSTLTGALTIIQGLTTSVVTAFAPGTFTPETWHSLGTLAGYTVTTGRYRLTPLGELELDIDVLAGGANAASVAFSVTLAAGYRPAANKRRVLGLAAGSLSTVEPNVVVSTAGVVTIGQNSANTVEIYGGAAIPLD